MKIQDVDWFFLSYYEPDATRNYEEILKINPNTKRVDGVRGFNAAHVAAAELSTTKRFITIDADTTWVSPRFGLIHVPDSVVNSDTTYHWNSWNPATRLAYGNGSLKMWSKQVAMHMLTHESLEGSVEFRGLDSKTMGNVYSHNEHRNPLQARVAAFREGYKFSTLKNCDQKTINGWYKNTQREVSNAFSCGYFMGHRGIAVDINDLDMLRLFLASSPMFRKDSDYLRGGKSLLDNPHDFTYDLPSWVPEFNVQ